MDVFGDVLKMVLPSGFILYGVYLVLRHQLIQERVRLSSSRADAVLKESLPVRLQAYERVCLLLARSAPQQLLPRVLDGNMNARLYQQRLLVELRNELNHNLSQQVYMSKALWQHVHAALEETIVLINESAAELKDEENAQTLAKRIFEKAAQKRFDSIEDALDKLRDEMKTLL